MTQQLTQDEINARWMEFHNHVIASVKDHKAKNRKHASNLRKAIISAEAQGKTVTITTNDFTYEKIFCTTKTGDMFAGISEGRLHRFHVGAVRTIEIV